VSTGNDTDINHSHIMMPRSGSTEVDTTEQLSDKGEALGVEMEKVDLGGGTKVST
jgi:hypothetical protein